MGIIAAAFILVVRHGNNLDKARWVTEPKRLMDRGTTAPDVPEARRETANPQTLRTEDGLPNPQVSEAVTTGDVQAGRTKYSPNLETPAVTTGQSSNRGKFEKSSPAAVQNEKAIQLAENFRLPATILAQCTDPTTPDAVVSPTVSAAAQEITESFYRALAATAQNTEQTPENTAPDAPDSEDTRVIPPTAETERLRAHSDERYRSLFGDAAYNKQSMNSLIEVRLPPLPKTESGE